MVVGSHGGKSIDFTEHIADPENQKHENGGGGGGGGDIYMCTRVKCTYLLKQYGHHKCTLST